MAVLALAAAVGAAALALAAGVAVPALAVAGAAVAAGIPVWASRPVSPPARFWAAYWRRPTVTVAIIRTAMASRPVMAMAARPFMATVTATATVVAAAVIPRKCWGRTALTWGRSASKICDQAGPLPNRHCEAVS